MKQAQEEERKQRLAEQQSTLRAATERRDKLESLRLEMARLFAEADPLKRGKALQGVLNGLFAAHGFW
jgi:hypothetical protein